LPFNAPRRRKRKEDCFLHECGDCTVQAGHRLDRVNKTKNRENGGKRAGALSPQKKMTGVKAPVPIH